MRRRGTARVSTGAATIAVVIAVAVAHAPATDARPGRRSDAHARRRGSSAPSRGATGSASPAAGARAAPGDIARLARGFSAYRAGDYAASQHELAPLAAAHLRSQAYVLHLLGESESLTGSRAAALRHLRALAAMQQAPRLAAAARARIADLLLAEHDAAGARRAYEALLRTPSPVVDLAVVRYRLAELAAAALPSPPQREAPSPDALPSPTLRGDARSPAALPSPPSRDARSPDALPSPTPRGVRSTDGDAAPPAGASGGAAPSTTTPPSPPLAATPPSVPPPPARDTVPPRGAVPPFPSVTPSRTVAAPAARSAPALAPSPAPATGTRAALPTVGATPPVARAVQRAAAAFRDVYIRHPEHPLAERALERMRLLDPGAAITAADRVARARRLTDARLWQRALDELALVPPDAPRAVRDEADYWIGTDHYKLHRGYDVAAEKLLAVADRLPGARRTEALFHGARALSRADQDDRAIAGYRDLVHRFPHAREAAEAAYLIGWLEYNRGRYREALPGFTAMLAAYPTSSFAPNARWYLAFSKYLLGDFAGAIGDLDRIGARPDDLNPARAPYWKALALLRLGRDAEAIALWRRVAGDHPLTCYGLLSRARLRERGVEVPTFDPSRPAPTVQPIGPVDPALAADADVARADELLDAGLDVEAGEELEAHTPALIARYGAARALPLLLDRYARANSFHRPHRLAERYGAAALGTDPHATPAARRWWEAMYPLAWRAFVEKYGPTGANPTYYLYTIMQKESAYDPHDVSFADAIGLLQMIPPTSRRVGARIGRPYTDDVLYDPEGNIQFGAWYIGHLLEKFKGQIALGAGAFNAGPQAMMKWVKKSGARPLDEFLELCAFTETREYMKKVLDIYAHYLYLYEHEEWLPDLKVDPKYLENDIDY